MRNTGPLLLLAITLHACNSGSGDGSGGGGGGSVALVRDAAVGAEFGSAGPRTCPDKKAPASGAPSKEQAAAYTICGIEGRSSDQLYLIDNVVVSDVAKGRAYNRLEDINMSNIDIERPVYAIRGSYDHYQCRYITKPGGYDMGPTYRKGSNCNQRRSANASGLCYVDTFGDWHCSMVDITNRDILKEDAAPPA